jgi:hypothetical protein
LGAFAEVFHEAGDTIEEDPFRADSIALPITMVPLIVVVGSVAAAWLSALAGVNSVVGTFLVLPVLAALTDVSMYALTLTTALGLGLAIDCSLFVASRNREELRAGYAPRVAASRTIRTVGFSALTVAESLLAGLVFPVRVPAQLRRRVRRDGLSSEDGGTLAVVAPDVHDAVPGLPIDAYATRLTTLPAVTRVDAATGTYRGTGSTTQLGCEHGKLVLPPRCSPRLAGFNIDGATNLSVIPWDSGGRQ